ncbi:PREDICTED: trichohyalin-like [Charadrius vociferus]|uniref:trichohyalin-like n=1 Tax=Charadrius vociferus TaxID=50402 RepID=UPI000521B849|nr:PREDICTED: trichohyalin-like [Charadrius vociferus]
MSHFLDSISTIISVFHQHAKEDGDCSNLSRWKMKELIQKEFADVIAKPRDPQMIDKILQFLEWDGDGKIDFNEFLLLVFKVAKACYWYLPKGPWLLQRTKLTTSGKSLQEPETKNRGNHRQLQEEERQNYESYHHPACEHELQRETRVNELGTTDETGSHHQQRNTPSRNYAKRRGGPGDPDPQVYEERSQEPCDHRNSQRRRQPPEPDRQRDVQLCKHGSLLAHEPRVQEDERQNEDRTQPEQMADVRSLSQTSESQPLPNRCSSHHQHETALPAYDQKNQWPQKADRGSHNQLRKPELLTEERNRYNLRELKQNSLEHSSHQPREPECLDSRRPHQSYIMEQLEVDLRYYETCEPKRNISERGKNNKHDLHYPEKDTDINEDKKCEEQDEERRKEPMHERRVDRQRELELEVYERRSRQAREREERAATTDQRERRERRDCQEGEPEDDGRRHRESHRESVRYERTRETALVEAEADVKIHRVSRELEAREEVARRDRPRECEAAEDERRICRGRETEGEGRTPEKSLYQTVDVDNRDLCPPGEQASVSDMRVRYIPANPDIRPEVQIVSQSCDPQSIAYLVHVVKNLNDPEATTYEIICHQPHNQEQPIYVKKCYVSPQPPALPCESSNHPELRSQSDEQETGEPRLLRQGSTPACNSQENTGDLHELQERPETGVKEGAHHIPASDPNSVKGDRYRAKPKEDRRHSQRPKMPDVEEKEEDGSKAAREQVPQDPESSCQVREHEDREAKSCPPLPQALEPQEACEPGRLSAKESCPQPSRRDEASHCHEDAELPPPEKSHQPQQEEYSKRSPQQGSDAQPQREEEPHLCTKQSQGPPVLQKAPSHPAMDEAKTS